MKEYKVVTHFLAVGVAALAAFVVSPAGQAVVHQYPVTSGIAGVITAVGAIYHSPKSE